MAPLPRSQKEESAITQALQACREIKSVIQYRRRKETQPEGTEREKTNTETQLSERAQQKGERLERTLPAKKKNI